ncbi:hypothetical protein TYRP_010341 [Tyrophagus putrescentiae]|nr:hypothetical protein TYRP_010341 [Tyrophagus putrescentiae]
MVVIVAVIIFANSENILPSIRFTGSACLPACLFRKLRDFLVVQGSSSGSSFGKLSVVLYGSQRKRLTVRLELPI